MDDLISRQAALEKVRTMQTYKLSEGDDMILVDKAEVQTELMMLPPVQPEVLACGSGELVAQPEAYWIPVGERLPEVGKTIIAQCRANIIKTLKLDSDGDWYQDAEHCYMSGFVVAWMPLPEPYKPNNK